MTHKNRTELFSTSTDGQVLEKTKDKNLGNFQLCDDLISKYYGIHYV